MSDEYQSATLDHLGLVAGMYDELGIGDLLDELIPQDADRRVVSIGQAVKAMVLNGLGFVNQRLYLVPHFFADKPVERLIGPGVEAAHLNDDVLGRALDSLYEHGVTALYRQIAQRAAERLGLTVAYVHLDSTSFHVDGRYNSEEAPAEGVVQLTRGYSRDHRPDLNQVVLNLISEQQAGIPLLMEPLSGNSEDKSGFRRVVQSHIGQLQMDHTPSYLVADSALYTETTLQALATHTLWWITRVPATLGAVQQLLAQVEVARLEPLVAGYRYQEVGAWYGGVPQRWFVLYSEARARQAPQAVAAKLLRATTREAKAWDHVQRQAFACKADAESALATFRATLQVTHLSEVTIHAQAHYATRGRPAADALATRSTYHVTGALATPCGQFAHQVVQHSCFVLATNQLDAALLTPAAVLAGYKGQSQVERGFRFLKDPLFLAAAFFLKRPTRIMALLMVMTLCLLVYAALQFRIRTQLVDQQTTFPDQKGKPTQTPTTRWVFAYFSGIHLVTLPTAHQLVLNLNPMHRALLGLLGPPYLALYS